MATCSWQHEDCCNANTGQYEGVVARICDKSGPTKCFVKCTMHILFSFLNGIITHIHDHPDSWLGLICTKMVHMLQKPALVSGT